MRKSFTLTVTAFFLATLVVAVFFGVQNSALAEDEDGTGDTTNRFGIGEIENDIVKCGGPTDFVEVEDDDDKKRLCEVLVKKVDNGADDDSYKAYINDKYLLNHCETDDVLQLVYDIIQLIMFTIAPALVTIFIIVGGVMYLVSPAVDLKAKGKNAIMYPLIGYVIILVAWMLVNTFLSVVGFKGIGFEGVGNWWQIEVQSSAPEKIKNTEKIRVQGEKGLVEIRGGEGVVELGDEESSANPNDDINISPDNLYIKNNKLYTTEGASVSAGSSTTSGSCPVCTDFYTNDDDRKKYCSTENGDS